MRRISWDEFQFFNALNGVLKQSVVITKDYKIDEEYYWLWVKEFGRDDQMSDNHELAADETASGHVETINWPDTWIDKRHNEAVEVFYESLKKEHGSSDDLSSLYEFAIRH